MSTLTATSAANSHFAICNSAGSTAQLRLGLHPPLSRSSGGAARVSSSASRIRSGSSGATSWLPAISGSSSGSEDRKSVVEGKSVSVRVDLGGRRIIKKQKNVHIVQLIAKQ